MIMRKRKLERYAKTIFNGWEFAREWPLIKRVPGGYATLVRKSLSWTRQQFETESIQKTTRKKHEGGMIEL